MFSPTEHKFMHMVKILCIRKVHSGESAYHITRCCTMSFLLVQRATLNATYQSFYRSNRKWAKKQKKKLKKES